MRLSVISPRQIKKDNALAKSAEVRGKLFGFIKIYNQLFKSHFLFF
jgi:hypothetical protein